MANKRQNKRFTFRCEAEFTTNNTTQRGIATDFSLSGLFMRTGNPLPPETILDIVIYLPSGQTSNLKGKVRRAARGVSRSNMGTSVRTFKSGMGIEIINKDANYLHFIRWLLG